MLVEPPYLFSGAEAEQAMVLPMHCQVVIHALSAGKPVSWQVSAALESLLHAKEAPSKEEQAGKGWDKLLHRLTARSVIRDHESTAQREAELEHGESCPGASTPRPARPFLHLLTPHLIRRLCPAVPPQGHAILQGL